MSQESDNKIVKKPSRRNFGRYFLVALLIFFLIVIALVVLSVVSAPFQTRLIKGYLDNKNEKMEENVQISEVSFHPLKGAVINDLLIEDYKQDTLLYAERFYSGLTDNVLTLFSNQLSLSELTLENAQLNIHTAKGDSLNNLERFIYNFGRPPPRRSYSPNIQQHQPPKKKQQQSDSTPMQLELDNVLLDQIQLTSYNENTTQSIIGNIEGMSIDVDQLNLNAKEININSFKLENPTLAFERTIKAKDIPVSTQQQSKEKQTQSNSNSPSKSEALSTGAEGNPIDENPIEENPWKVSVGQFDLVDGNFKSKIIGDVEYSNPHLHIDYSDFEVSDVNISFEELMTNLKSDVDASNFSLKGSVAEDNKSYEFRFDALEMDGEEAVVDGFNIKAGSSSLQSDVVMIYDDFKNFNQFADKVFLNLNFKRSNIAFKDVAYFLPRLSNTPTIDKNINKVISLSGQIKGRLNNFSSKEINLTIPDVVQFAGAIRIKDATDPDKAFLSIRTERLSTSISRLTKIIPGFDPPANYYKLGEIDYSGTFSGFTYDFVANGNLQVL